MHILYIYGHLSCNMNLFLFMSTLFLRTMQQKKKKEKKNNINLQFNKFLSQMRLNSNRISSFVLFSDDDMSSRNQSNTIHVFQ